MPLYRGNDSRVDTGVLTDSAGTAITTGPVDVEIFSEDGATSYIAKAAMTHIGSPDGTWRKDYNSTEIDTIPAGVVRALERVTVAAEPDATLERIQKVEARRV